MCTSNSLGRRAALTSLLAMGALPWAKGHASASGGVDPKRLVVVLLRGAIDGLSVVAPYTERAYRDARPTIALPPPGREGGLIDLDGRFGLNPALASLRPLWDAGQLGFVQACGAQVSGRSHFEAQDELEAGTPGKKSTPDGWMGRLLNVQERGDGVHAVYAGSVRPRILRGSADVAALPGSVGGSKRAARRMPRGGTPAGMSQGLDDLYANDPRYGQAWLEGQRGRAQMSEALSAKTPAMASTEMGDQTSMGGSDSLEREMLAANNGAPLPNGFPEEARRLAQVMRADGRVQFALLQVGGWDTHARQGASKGQLANRLEPLGLGLATLARELGPVWNDTVVMVVSEFGRTVRENGNGGTDHGHGNALWLLGGQVQGGQVKGDWPGLETSALHQGRDLAITTDYRAAFAGMAAQHLGLKDAQLANVFPGYSGGLLKVMKA